MTKKKIKFGIIGCVLLFCVATVLQADAQKTTKDYLSFPYISNLVTSPETEKIAWVSNRKGVRKIFVSTDKGNSYKRYTNSRIDDGQDRTRLQFSPDGQWIIYFKGADLGGNRSRNVSVNPRARPLGTSFRLYSINLNSGKVKSLVVSPSSNQPAISPDSKRVVFIKSGKVWVAPLDGAAKAKRLFTTKGACSFLEWSPDGSKLAFVVNRSGHSFIGIYRDAKTSIQWLDPSFAKDSYPRWSPDGKSIAFIRTRATGGEPDSILSRTIKPWEIRVANLEENSSRLVWKSPNTFAGSAPTSNGKYNLHWAANNKIVFLATLDNWPHLYSISIGDKKPMLLTPGNFMVEYVQLSPDKTKLLFSANTGKDPLDIDRRHIGMVSVDHPDMKILTDGDGLEVTPQFINNDAIAFLSSTWYRPVLPAILDKDQSKFRLVAEKEMPSWANKKNMVQPKQVVFTAPDGTKIHGQVFEKQGDKKKKPAVLAIHGGPMRQMVLGWHNSGYYATQYAVNQQLANMGFIVLSVNYRLGIGYGNEFRHPEKSGRHGASEYQDILAAGQWLTRNPSVDPARIGVYGGSYGGYLTAFALGRNSDIFAAGVDIHGVHSRVPSQKYTSKPEPAPDAALADEVAWESSPIAYVDTWKSPVLMIHGDDDRNVGFGHSINLYNRLKDRDVDVETLVIPNDTHHWMLFRNLSTVYQATVSYLNEKLNY